MDKSSKASYEIRLKQWIPIIQEANASGMTKQAWCRENGVPVHQFHYWQKKVRDFALQEAGPEEHSVAAAVPARKQDKPPVFCELAVPVAAENADSHPPLDSNGLAAPEVVLLYGQFQLLIGSTVSERTLATVLAAIRHV